MKFTRITVNPKQMDGLPCIRGLRIPVATVVGMVADGMTDDEILNAYPISSVKISAKLCDSLPRPCANVNFHS